MSNPPSSARWNTGAGDWSIPANWTVSTSSTPATVHRVPGADDAVDISNAAGTAFTVTYDDTTDIWSLGGGGNVKVALIGGSLTVDHDSATQDAIDVGSGASLNAAAGARLAFSAGTISGTLGGAGTIAFVTGAFSLNNGTILAVAGLTLGATGAESTTTLNADLAYGGHFTIDASGSRGAATLNLNGHALTLTGSAMLNGYITGPGTLLVKTAAPSQFFAHVTGTTIEIASDVVQVASGTSSMALSGTLTIDKGASYTLKDHAGINAPYYYDESAPGNIYTNNGTFVDDSDGGTAKVGGGFTNNGTMTVKATDTLYLIGDNTLGGTIDGAGTLLIGAGKTTLTASTLTVASLGLVTAPHAANVLTLGVDVTYGGAFILAGGYYVTLNLNGHRFTLTGSSNSLGRYNTIEGPGTLVVTGSADIAYSLNVTSKSAPAAIIDAGAMTQSMAELNLQGTLQVSAKATYSFVASSINDHGATILNDGMLIVGTLVNQSGLYGASAIAGTFVNTGTLSIASEAVLTVSGTDTFGGTIVGSGKLIASGASTLGVLTVGGGLLVRNTGTVTQTGTITLGDGTTGAARLTNAPGRNWTIEGDVGVIAGHADSLFNNGGGTLTKASGTGVSTIGADVVNLAGTAATVAIAAGTLNFTGEANSFLADTISGPGLFSIRGGGVSTIGAGTTITTSAWAIGKRGTVVDLAENLAYGGAFSDTNTTVLDLGANSLTLTGTAAFNLGPVGAPRVTGSGQLILAGTTTVGSLAIGGTVQIRDTGTVIQTGAVTLGDATGMAELSVGAGGRWLLAGDVGIGAGSTAAVINIVGAYLAKTAGTTTRSIIAPDIENLSTTASVIRAKVGKLELAGTLLGPLDLRVNPGATLILDKQASAGTTATFVGAGGTLHLNDAPDYQGYIAGFAAGDRLDLRSILDGAGSTPTLAYAGHGSSGTLTVSDGARITHLAMVGTYAQARFSLATDGHGGTLVTYR